MNGWFIKPRLNHDQKSRVKRLYERNNYKGFLPIAADVAWIVAACTEKVGQRHR